MISDKQRRLEAKVHTERGTVVYETAKEINDACISSCRYSEYDETLDITPRIIRARVKGTIMEGKSLNTGKWIRIA
jgi:hypothetical protein